MDFQPKLIKLLMVLNLVYVHQYHLPSENSLQNSTHNLSFEVYLQFFILCDVYFFDTNTFQMFKFVNVFWGFL
jgi:hypothetical protein